MIRSTLAVAVLLAVATPALADTTIVTDAQPGTSPSESVIIIRSKPIQPTPNAPVETDPYNIEGQVTKIDLARNEITVQYEAIVERRISVRDVHLSTLKRGDFVHIQLQDDSTANKVIQLN